jgi:hypothetical protein
VGNVKLLLLIYFKRKRETEWKKKLVSNVNFFDEQW